MDVFLKHQFENRKEAFPLWSAQTLIHAKQKQINDKNDFERFKSPAVKSNRNHEV